MNPDVQGKFIDRSPNELCEDESVISEYTLVIANEIYDKHLVPLSKIC